MRRWIAHCVVAAVLPLTGTGCIVVGLSGPSVWTTAATERLQVDTASLSALEVRTHNGAITFDGQPAGSSEAFVTATKRGGGLTPADAEAALEAIDVFVEPTGAGTQRIGWRWRGVKALTWSGQVSFDIHAPGRISFDGETHNGAVKVQGVTGDVKVITHNGRVNVESRSGKLYARTHNGGIDATYAGGDVTLLTHNGKIVADFRGCSSVDGAITTHNGSVEVLLGDATSASLDCHTHNGGIKCDVPIKTGHFTRRRLTGTIGTGAGTLNVTTHNGGVHIKKAS